MRILYLTSGYSVHDQRYLVKCVENKYEVYMVSYTSAKDPMVKISGVKVIKPKLNFKYHFPFIPLHFKKLMKEIKPDILHACYIQTQGFAGALSGFHPFVLQPMGSDIMLWLDNAFSFINRPIARYTINHADFIIPDCEIVKKRIVDISSYSEEKMELIPWGINLKLFRYMKEERNSLREKLGWTDKKILIMTRNFLPVYGVKYFIHALSNIIKEEKDCRAIVVGDGCGDRKLELELKELAIKLHINEYVHFTGALENHLIPLYLSAADVYVTSSLSDGTSLSLLEAFACKLPVVVSDVPSNLEWVKDGVNGFVTPRGNIDILSNKILEILKDAELRQRFGEANIEIVNNRGDWDNNFGKLSSIYERLTRKK